jgi:hypothetical protein
MYFLECMNVCYVMDFGEVTIAPAMVIDYQLFFVTDAD